jgi:hypothetical protein
MSGASAADFNRGAEILRAHNMLEDATQNWSEICGLRWTTGLYSVSLSSFVLASDSTETFHGHIIACACPYASRCLGGSIPILGPCSCCRIRPHQMSPSSGEFQRRDGLGRGLGGWLGSTTRLYLDTGIVVVPHQMGWDLVSSCRPHQMKV